MLITVQEKTQKQVEIELPHFSKDSCHFFKVISEKNSIAIHEGVIDCRIEQLNFVSGAFDNDAIPCTESEFKEAYERISKRIAEFL